MKPLGLRHDHHVYDHARSTRGRENNSIRKELFKERLAEQEADASNETEALERIVEEYEQQEQLLIACLMEFCTDADDLGDKNEDG